MKWRMIALSSSCALCLTAGLANAQRPSTAAPLTRASATTADTATSEFYVNGLHVILRRNTANDVVAANVYLLGGTQQLTPATQGIEAFLLAASERGTARYPGPVTRDRTARLGADIEIEPTADWTRVGFTTIRSAFDSTCAIMADRIAEPTLDSAQVEITRTALLSLVTRAETEPDALLTTLADSLEFAGEPYGLEATGTDATLRAISLAQLRQYERTQMITSRMLLVVVGNMDRAALEPLVQRTLGALPRGSYAWTAPPVPATQSRALVTRTMSLPTNYILGYYEGPPATSPDYEALRVATAVLGGRFFTEIRSQRNLSYAVDAPFVENAYATGGVYVTTVDPNTTLQLMRAGITRLQQETIDSDGLQRLVQQFITEYFLKNETNSDQASFLARFAIYDGDYRLADQFIANLRRVTAFDVQRVARKYMHDFRFVYLGDPSKLSRQLLTLF
jgi:zinc protease